MGRSRKYKGGLPTVSQYELTQEDIRNQQIQQSLSKMPTPSAPPYEPTPSAPPYEPTPSAPPYEPTPSAPPYEPTPSAPPYKPTPSAPPYEPTPSAPPYKPTPSAPPYEPTPSASSPLSPEAIIERYKPGIFTSPIPGIRSTLTWAQLRDLSTTQLTEEEAISVTDPHELFRSLVGADGTLLTALRDATEGIRLPVETTNEIQGLLSGWMDVRRGFGLPPILDPDGREITVARLNPLSCRISDRPDLAEYSYKWNIVSSFVEASPPIFKAVFAEGFIPTTITGGSEGGMACLEGFCDYAFLKMRDAVTTCFAREDREQPTVLPPVTGLLKMRRGRTTVSAFLQTQGRQVQGVLTIEPFRERIMDLLITTYPGVNWTDNDITTIFNELRIAYGESYRGGKTRRKRKRRKTKTKRRI